MVAQNFDGSQHEHARDDYSDSHYAAVVLYYKLGPQVANTIDSLRLQTHPPSEILIVDNDSQDGVLDALLKQRPECKIIRLSENGGYSAGMNAGGREVQDRVKNILFLTHEVQLAPDCAQKLIASLVRDRHTMVGPKLLREQSGRVWSTGGTISFTGDVRHFTEPRERQEVQWLDGACLLIDARAFREVGGFDERFFLYWEDVDISMRMRRRGTIECVANATASQETGTSPVYFRTRNQILLWRKHRKPLHVTLSIVSAVIRLGMKDLRRWQFDRARARAAGIRDGISGGLTLRHSSIRGG